MRSQGTTTAASAALALLLSLGAGACSSRDATGPAISLTPEEVYQLAGELGAEMNNYIATASLRAARASIRAAWPARAAAASVPLSGSAVCLGGGTTTMTGSYDEGTTTTSANATFSYSGCKTAHFTTDGSFSGSGEVTATQVTTTGHATIGGMLHVGTADGRSGTCPIDVTVDVTTTRTGAMTFVISGSACGVTVNQTYTPPLFRKPAGAIAVSIVVDDAANKVYSDGQLAWKGSMVYDPTTNMITPDPFWFGPWPLLYDDGPMSAGGHEPEGSVAGDHRFGAVVFVMPPATGATTYEYGMIDHTVEMAFGNGWIWLGPNGSFTVNAGATADQRVAGMALRSFGATDMQLVLDTRNLDPSGTWDLTTVSVEGSAWEWGVLPLTNDGTGKYVFTLSNVAGAGKLLPHAGLTTSGDKPRFMFVLSGTVYTDSSGAPSIYGVSAGTRASGASAFTATTVLVDSTRTPYITIP